MNSDPQGGRPISYEVLAPGTPVFDSGGTLIGQVEKVLADEAEDIFDGIVISTKDGTRLSTPPISSG